MNGRRWMIGLAAAIGLVNLLPVLLVLKQAVTPEAESLSWPPTWFPHVWSTENVRNLGDSVELGSGLALSLLVAFLTVFSTIAIALPAAWAAVHGPRLDRALDRILVLARSFPTIAVGVPLASLFVGWGLYNSPWGLGLWLAHTLLALPLAFLILRNALRDLPSSVIEAARLDGAGGGRLLWHVLLPLVRPSLAAAAMLVFLLSWDELAYSLLVQVTNRPLPPLLFYLASFGYPGLASAVAAVMLVPALAIVAVLEPALRSGVFAGSSR